MLFLGIILRILDDALENIVAPTSSKISSQTNPHSFAVKFHSGFLVLEVCPGP